MACAQERLSPSPWVRHTPPPDWAGSAGDTWREVEWPRTTKGRTTQRAVAEGRVTQNELPTMVRSRRENLSGRSTAAIAIPSPSGYRWHASRWAATERADRSNLISTSRLGSFGRRGDCLLDGVMKSVSAGGCVGEGNTPGMIPRTDAATAYARM